MTTRTWAVWNRNRFLAYALPIFYFAIWAGALVLNAIFVQSLKCQHSIFYLPNVSPAFLILFISVNPNPLTPYVGCYPTQVDPIIFISWILLLFYDTGAIVIYHATWSSFAEGSCVSDVHIDGHSSVKSL